MDVKRCDRCGAIYELNSTPNGSDVIWFTATMMPWEKRTSFCINGQAVVLKEICEQCVEDFKEWLRNAK